jgi:hypothetical protein
MADFNNTKQEIEGSFEFKAAKRIVMQEFPWIKDISVTDKMEELNKYRLVFVDIDVDPALVYNYTGWLPLSWVKRYILLGSGDYSPYLSSIFDITYEEAKEQVVDPIDKMFEEINKSTVIPSHLKLPNYRKLAIGTWRIPQGYKPPESYITNISK